MDRPINFDAVLIEDVITMALAWEQLDAATRTDVQAFIALMAATPTDEEHHHMVLDSLPMPASRLRSIRQFFAVVVEHAHADQSDGGLDCVEEIDYLLR